MQTIRSVFSPVGIIKMEMASRNLSLTLAEVINDTTSGLNGIRISLNSLVQVLADSHSALDFLWASLSGIRTAVDSCSTCINDWTWQSRLYITIMKNLLVSLRLVLMVYKICSWPELGNWNSWLHDFIGTTNGSCFCHEGHYVAPLHSAPNSQSLIRWSPWWGNQKVNNILLCGWICRWLNNSQALKVGLYPSGNWLTFTGKILTKKADERLNRQTDSDQTRPYLTLELWPTVSNKQPGKPNHSLCNNSSRSQNTTALATIPQWDRACSMAACFPIFCFCFQLRDSRICSPPELHLMLHF